MDGKLETARTLVELGVDKEAKDKVRNRMMMMMMMVIIIITIYRHLLYHNKYHYHHVLFTTIIILDIIILKIFLFYLHVSSLYYDYRMDGLLSTGPVGMVNWRLYVL